MSDSDKACDQRRIARPLQNEVSQAVSSQMPPACATTSDAQSTSAQNQRQMDSKRKIEEPSTQNAKLSNYSAEYRREYNSKQEERAEFLLKEAQRPREYRSRQNTTTLQPTETEAEWKREYKALQRAKEAQRLRKYRARKKATSLQSTKMEAEYKKEYRVRQRATSQPEERAEFLSKEAQRLRDYRARKKALPTSDAVTSVPQVQLVNDEATDKSLSDEDNDPHLDVLCRTPQYSAYAPSFLKMELTEDSQDSSSDTSKLSNPWFSALPAAGTAGTPTTPGALRSAAHDGYSHLEEDSSSSFSIDENTSYFQFFRGIYTDYQELSARKQRKFKRQALIFLYDLLGEEDTDRGGLPPEYMEQASLGAPGSESMQGVMEFPYKTESETYDEHELKHSVAELPQIDLEEVNDAPTYILPEPASPD